MHREYNKKVIPKIKQVDNLIRKIRAKKINQNGFLYSVNGI